MSKDPAAFLMICLGTFGLVAGHCALILSGEHRPFALGVLLFFTLMYLVFACYSLYESIIWNRREQDE